MAHEAAAPAGRSPETVDRLMVGICGAIWLVLLAAGAVATVALVRLGSGHPGRGEGQSSWLLYSIVVVSALVILGAIPLLMRARRSALADARRVEAPDEDAPAAPARPIEAPTEKMRVFGVDPYARKQAESQPVAARASQALVERIFLRGTTSLLGAIGLALTSVAIGTYLLADASDTAAWVAFGLAGVIAVVMPGVLVFFQRQLAEVIDRPEG